VLLMRLFAVVLVAAAIWALAVGEISLQPE
jgi:hypothetical protein